VEPGEIQSHLLKHPAVSEAAVVARQKNRQAPEIVAYVVPQQSVSVTDLRAHLARTLPHYMVPAAFVRLGALPLTPNGKVDHRALPEPDRARPDLQSDYTPPRSPTEERLADIWARVLEVERVGAHDNFFELGGHSLLATRVMWPFAPSSRWNSRCA